MFSFFSAIAAIPSINIVGGETAQPFEYPWLANLEIRNKHMCGGTMLNPTTVLTAGHCTSLNSTEIPLLSVTTHRHDLSKSVEAEQGLKFQVLSQFRHEKYNDTFGDDSFIDYDVAIWKVQQVFGDVPDYKLALDNGTYSQVGTPLIVAGWGNTQFNGNSSSVLLKVDVPITTDELCSNAYPGIGNTSVCAGYPEGVRDACNGDSGGPLFKKTDNGIVLVGIVSSGRECAKAGYPGIYARIANPEITKFILEHI